MTGEVVVSIVPVVVIVAGVGTVEDVARDEAGLTAGRSR